MSLVRVNIGERKVEIGDYNTKDKILKMKDLSIFIKGGEVNFPISLIKFLIRENAVIEAKNKNNGCTYSIDPKEVSINGEELDEVIIYPLEFCELKSMKKGTRVMSCWNGKCIFCKDGICTKGVISINSKGECEGFEENPYIKE